MLIFIVTLTGASLAAGKTTSKSQFQDYLQQKVKFLPILLGMIGSTDSNSSRDALKSILNMEEIPKDFSSQYIIAARSTQPTHHIGTVDDAQKFYSFGLEASDSGDSYELVKFLKQHDDSKDDPIIARHKR